MSNIYFQRKTVESTYSYFNKTKNQFKMSRYRIKQKRRLKNINERLINQIGHELSLAEDELNEVLFGASCTINNEQELNEGAVSSNLRCRIMKGTRSLYQTI